MKQQTACPRYIYKINSSRLRKSRWNLTLSLAEARKNDELIALADSQVLRWLDELNGITDADERAAQIRREIKSRRKAENSVENRKAIRQLYQKLDAIQFKPDYMCLVIDKEKDYWRACRGFSINGISYKRLLGTNGGIKSSTIVFISERHIGEIQRRINNGRNMEQKIVPAKLEAYKALACSASIPVSWPKGILVVKDFETVFHEDTIYLSDENDGEPLMELQKDTEIHLDGCDGCGIMLPSLAERWSEELGLDYVMSAANTRLSFEKGMIFTFDFLEFAEKVAGKYMVEDVWGNMVDIRNVELIFTESMLKLWDGYDSIDSYLECCRDNGYTVCVTKVCPKVLENQRALNYQFIQSFNLTYDDIDELIAPTVNTIHDLLGGDWAKMVLFLAGEGVGSVAPEKIKAGVAKAIMADKRAANDPYIKSKIYELVKNRINEAKVGVLDVHGNYSIVSGDPYALCQSIFGMEVTGLLKAGEIYNRYWIDNSDSDELICFRAPMSVHNNIRKVSPCRREDAAHWYQYITTGTILNCWDTMTAALNGCDFDGDLLMITDNPVLVRRHVKTPTIMCVQRRAEKKIPTIDDIIRSNIAAFGNDIGKTTNWVTSMYEVQSHFAPGSREYEELAYRMKVGQLIQQNVIDRAKGIVAKPMERSWHDRHTVNQIEDEDKQRFYRSIVADKKPYFMRYIYPSLMKEYKNYLRKSDAAAIREFRMTVGEMQALPYCELTDRQKEFLRYYELGMPVGVGDCVLNRICRRIEEEFDGFIGKSSATSDFDVGIYKNGVDYTPYQYYMITKLYEEYRRRRHEYTIYVAVNDVDSDESVSNTDMLFEEFRRACVGVCGNDDELLDILVDIWYSRKTTNALIWSAFPELLVNTLIRKNGNRICVPVKDPDGEIYYRGERYTIQEKELEGFNEYYSERTGMDEESDGGE